MSPGAARDRNGLEVLYRQECLELLATETVGRLAATAYASPAIFPLTYRLIAEDVVFATGTGSKLLAVIHGDPVAFEVDHIRAVSRTGWSVLVVGKAEQITEGHPRWDVVRSTDFEPWAPRWATHFVRIPTTQISGRRLRGARSYVAAPAVAPLA